MRKLLAIPGLLILLGCSHHHATTSSVADAQPEPFSDMLPAGDSHFSAEDQRIVAAARAWLEKDRQQTVDARYRVERTKDGYEVFAMFVAGYENGRPLFYPGGHGIVFLDRDGTFVRYARGE